MLKKAKQNSLVQNIVNQIEEAIVDGKFEPRSKLPSPQELQEMLGASRGTLREALRVLQQKGLIEIKLGVKGGAFVKEFTTESITEGLSLLIRQREISLSDLSEFRIVVESGLISLVVERIQKNDLDELKQYLIEFQTYMKEGASGWYGYLEAEVRLRKHLIQIASNRMYEAVLLPIHENIVTYAHKYLPGERAKIKQAYQDWCQIIDALEKKDADTAVSITKDHIARYFRLMKQGKTNSNDN